MVWTGAGLGSGDLFHREPHQSSHPGLPGCPQTSCAGNQWGRVACFHYHRFLPAGETKKEHLQMFFDLLGNNTKPVLSMRPLSFPLFSLYSSIDLLPVSAAAKSLKEIFLLQCELSGLTISTIERINE